MLKRHESLRPRIQVWMPWSLRAQDGSKLCSTVWVVLHRRDEGEAPASAIIPTLLSAHKAVVQVCSWAACCDRAGAYGCISSMKLDRRLAACAANSRPIYQPEADAL